MKADRELLLHQAVAVLSFLEKNEFKQPALKLKKQLEKDFEGKVPKVKDLDGEWKWESHYESSSDEEEESEYDSSSSSESESEEEDSESESESDDEKDKRSKKKGIDKKANVTKNVKNDKLKEVKAVKKEDSDKKAKDTKKANKDDLKESNGKKAKDTKKGKKDDLKEGSDKKAKETTKNVKTVDLKEGKIAEKKHKDHVDDATKIPANKAKPDFRRQRNSFSDDDESKVIKDKDKVEEAKDATIDKDKGETAPENKGKPAFRRQRISFSDTNEVNYISPRKPARKKELFYNKMDVERFRIDVEQERMAAIIAETQATMGVNY